MENLDWKIVGSFAGLISLSFTIFKSIRSRFGRLLVIISFRNGRSEYMNHNYKKQFSELGVEIYKKGYKEIWIDNIRFENENVDKSDSHKIDLNEYIKLTGFEGLDIKRNNKIRRYHEFGNDDALATVFKMTRTRAVVVDTKGKKYYSQWLTIPHNETIQTIF